MFVAEPTSLIDKLKVTVYNTEGHDYSMEIPNVTTVERVKMMAVGHFFGHQEAVAGSSHVDMKGTGHRTYRLIVLRGARPLLDVNSLHSEKLKDNDILLLVECRLPVSHQQASADEMSAPTMQQIALATAHVPKRNDSRDPDPTNTSSDFQTEFRRILVTMIEASVRLISADPDSKEVFSQILDKLERRHRPRVDRSALRQLTEMGFVEAKATKALQVKRNFSEAVEWLLDEGNLDDGDVKTIEDTVSLSSDSSPEKSSFDDQQEDPAKKILKQFLQYRKKWFQPNPQAVLKLTERGFSEERAKDALRACGNNGNTAHDLLVDKAVFTPDDQGLERDSPIISAILASPVIQLALPKPKTLLALMMLYESPSNANMWLSDPDTHPVVSQVLRIYHAEKHSLNHNRSLSNASNTSNSSTTQTFGSSNNSQPEYHRSLPRCAPMPRNSSSNSSSPRSLGSNSSFGHEQQSPLPWTMGNPHLRGLSSGLSPNSSPVHQPRVDTLPSSGHIISVEPMSHSGSPVGLRGAGTSVGPSMGSSMANGGPPQQLTSFSGSSMANGGSLQQLRGSMATTSFPCHSILMQDTTTTDIEMDETGQDSQDMETQDISDKD